MVLDYAAIGARIREARSVKDMSQERLAELAGLSTTHTSHIETGNTRVSIPSLIKITNALGVSLDELEIRVISDMAKTLKTSMRWRLGD